uniref:Uncharacterized protein n=1 Tax=Craspedostauros australis TaxID=1486917 RepID=A0A7R9WTM7_9STRA|mmetsp:Transcript_18989/g.52763  ORF Transcript_18989/g.52763 Transcript_18989/m.52763 type:complete len:125 (+) Transcript_18989:55-429(+)
MRRMLRSSSPGMPTKSVYAGCCIRNQNVVTEAPIAHRQNLQPVSSMPAFYPMEVTYGLRTLSDRLSNPIDALLNMWQETDVGEAYGSLELEDPTCHNPVEMSRRESIPSAVGETFRMPGSLATV